MSHKSEEQYKPTGVICPICVHESLALGNRVKGHICIPDFLDTDVRFSVNYPSISLEYVAKSVLGVK